MIRYVKGNIFNSTCKALCNPVNVVGIMGAGLAKQFKARYPKMFEVYKDACFHKWLQPGGVHVYWGDTDDLNKCEHIVINIATKKDWRQPSQLGWVEEGLWNLRDRLEYYGIESVAIPPLGCGLGGLDWETVKSAIEKEFKDSDITVEIYEPL